MKRIIIKILICLFSLTTIVYAQTDNESTAVESNDQPSQQNVSVLTTDQINQLSSNGDDIDATDPTSTDTKSQTWYEWLWGTPQQNSIYLGMFTLHFSPGSIRNDNWNNELIGGTYKGIFAGTLINSFYNRAYVAGVSRDLYKNQLSDDFEMTAGYRAGLITGYDLDINEFTSHLPALPFVQTYLDFTYKDVVGVEFSYVGIVVTAGFYIRF